MSSGDFWEQLDAENLWEGHVLDPGNLYEQVGFFVAIPTWWRRFAFRVLEPLDVTVYLYICSYMSTQRSARPTIQTIANDLGKSNRHGVTNSLKRLVERGFLIRERMPSHIINENRHPRYIYQRPSIAFTVATLLVEGFISGYLQPTLKTMRRGQEQLPGAIESRLGKPLVEPLKKLIGDEGFVEYAKAPNELRKRQVLITHLESAVNAMRAGAKAAPRHEKRRSV